MRPLLLLLALLPTAAAAKCASASFSAWPPHDAPLPANGVLLVEGFGDDQPMIAELKDGQAWLEGSGGRVPLAVEATRVGHFRLTQAVLRPTQPLKPGRTYTLVLTRDGQPYRPQRWIDAKRVPITWHIAAADQTPPTWTAAPTITERTHVEYGCGPATEVVASAPAHDAGPVLIEVTLASVGEASTWWLPMDDGTIRIGHGMCSGAFDVSGALPRIATLVAIDAAGHRAPAPADLRFAGVVPSEGR